MVAAIAVQAVARGVEARAMARARRAAPAAASLVVVKAVVAGVEAAASARAAAMQEAAAAAAVARGLREGNRRIAARTAELWQPPSLAREMDAVKVPTNSLVLYRDDST